MMNAAYLTSSATGQLRLARTGGMQRVKRNLSIIFSEGGAEAIATLAETWAQIRVATKGFGPITDPRADEKIVDVANEFLALLMIDQDAARALIITHPEPLFVASVLLVAAV